MEREWRGRSGGDVVELLNHQPGRRHSARLRGMIQQFNNVPVIERLRGMIQQFNNVPVIDSRFI
jgi:hypothetical protein